MVDLGEQLLLVQELKMRTQPRIECFAKLSGLRIVINPLRMEKSSNAVLVAQHPSLGKKTLVEIGFRTFEQRIVLPCIQEALGRTGFGELRHPRFAKAVSLLERLCS